MALDSFQGLPTGTVGKREVSKEEKVPVVEVANEVVWINPAFQSPDSIASLRLLPFVVNIGEQTNLGIFATSGIDHGRTAQGTPKHRRSLILAHSIFRDTSGRLYRDVDAKGTGYIEYIDYGGESADELRVEPIQDADGEGGMMGIFERKDAEHDAVLAEKFISLDIRTYRVIAITKLKELVQHGKRYSVDEAKRQRIIPNGSEPVVSIRAFGTRDRIGDLSLASANPHRKSIEDARLMVAQELGRDSNEFGETEYFQWFSETLAGNIARMHQARFIHGYLSTHNITLDCRIVDLDSVQHGSEPSMEDVYKEYLLLRAKGSGAEHNLSYSDDLFQATESLRRLADRLPERNPEPAIVSNFEINFEKKYLKALAGKSGGL